MLKDRNWDTGWTSPEPQRAGMGFTVEFSQTQEIHQIKLVYPHRTTEVPKVVEVYDTSESGKRTLIASSPHQWSELLFQHQKPTYQQNHHTIWFNEPISLQSIEIEISEPMLNKKWQLQDILFATGSG